MTKHDHRIDRDEALTMIRRRDERVKGEQKRSANAVGYATAPAHGLYAYHGGTFDRAIIDEMMAQDGATGLRVYRGDHKDGRPAHILVAVDANGDDLTAVIAEIERPCPPVCAPSGILGSGDL